MPITKTMLDELEELEQTEARGEDPLGDKLQDPLEANPRKATKVVHTARKKKRNTSARATRAPGPPRC